MNWIVQLIKVESVAQAALVLSIVAALGIAIGSLKIRGIGLGIAGVLFSGLFIGHFLGKANITLDHRVMEFAREFGLILFVYTIGMQVGPGFFASLRKQGLPLNLMAAGIVLLGVAITIGVHYIGHVPIPAAVGLFSGGTTNTPSLGAAQEALKGIKTLGPNAVDMPALAYAVAYPFGIVGIILTMVLVRTAFSISPQKELELLVAMRDENRVAMKTMNIELKNPNLEGIQLNRIPTLADSGVVISRILQGGKPLVARGDTVLKQGDVLLAVGPAPRLDELRMIVGSEAKVDIIAVPSDIITRRILVTQSDALGKTIDELNLRERLGVNVTRVARADMEMPPKDLRLQFGDNLVVVGAPLAVKQAAAELGDQISKLNHPQIIPVFVGIALGILVGSWPLTIPGIPAPVKLGLAGGPLIVAIVLARLGHARQARLAFADERQHHAARAGHRAVPRVRRPQERRQVRRHRPRRQGPVLDGLRRGDHVRAAVHRRVHARRMFYKVNYLNLCGLLAGSMTDPPALAFAQSVTNSEAPSVAYATVYPLVMLLRVLLAQIMVLTLAG